MKAPRDQYDRLLEAIAREYGLITCPLCGAIHCVRQGQKPECESGDTGLSAPMAVAV